MLFAKVYNAAIKELEQALRNADQTKWYRRLKIIDLSAQGHRVPELAYLFDLGEASVRRYIKQYNEGGLDNLRPGKSSGRQASIPLSKEEWEDLLAQSLSQEEIGTISGQARWATSSRSEESALAEQIPRSLASPWCNQRATVHWPGISHCRPEIPQCFGFFRYAKG